VTTKVGTGWSGAVSEHPLAVLDLIREGVGRAVERIAEARPFRFDPPLQYDLRFKRMDAAESWARQRRLERVDAFTVRQQADGILDLF
jgi:D-amino peptidase